MLKRNNPFKAFYDELNDIRKRDVREKTIAQLEISEETFRRRTRTNKWKTIDKNVIAKIVDKPVDELFPQIIPTVPNGKSN